MPGEGGDLVQLLLPQPAEGGRADEAAWQTALHEREEVIPR